MLPKVSVIVAVTCSVLQYGTSYWIRHVAGAVCQRTLGDSVIGRIPVAGSCAAGVAELLDLRQRVEPAKTKD